MSDTCSLFPLFGDPWPSCLLPSQREERPVVIIPTLSLHREGSESCLYGNRGDMWSLALSTESNMLDATGRRLFTSQDPTKQAGPSTMTFREEAGLLALQAQLSLIAQSCPTLCDPMDSRLLRPWDFLGKSTGVGCHFLLQRIFPTQGLNPGLLHCRWTLHCLSRQGNLLGS